MQRSWDATLGSFHQRLPVTSFSGSLAKVQELVVDQLVNLELSLRDQLLHYQTTMRSQDYTHITLDPPISLQLNSKGLYLLVKTFIRNNH